MVAIMIAYDPDERRAIIQNMINDVCNKHIDTIQTIGSKHFYEITVNIKHRKSRAKS